MPIKTTGCTNLNELEEDVNLNPGCTNLRELEEDKNLNPGCTMSELKEVSTST